MADVDFTTVQGTTAPLLAETLAGPDGNALNLAGATSVELRIAPVDRSVAATVVVAVVSDAPNGRVQAALPPLAPAEYDYQWIVTFLDGQVVAVPGDRYRRMRVLALLV